MPGGDLYDVSKIIDKTLVADKDLPVFDSVPTKANKPMQIGIVLKGNPAGIVYSYINADPANNRPNVWWMFYPATTNGPYYYMPHNAGDFNVSAIRQQGVISVQEQVEEDKRKEEDANKEWYEKIMDRVIPVGATVIIAAAIIKGIFSHK